MVKDNKMTYLILFLLFLFLLYYFFAASAPRQKNIVWGVNFSQAHAQFLKLDWRKAYLAILEDLGVKNIKLITNWDFVENKKGNYYFNDVDWQIKEADKHGAKLIYVVGMKTGRWPECHIPKWALTLSKKEQQEEILKYIKEVVLRYKNQKSIIAWQAENEPLFEFGVCPWYDEDFLKKEVSLIKSLDPTRPVIVSDSGEQSFWFRAANIGDIVGTTMYRTVWVHVTDNYGFFMNFPLPPLSYWLKAQLIKGLFNKEVINVELQAEPWVPDIYVEVSLQQQEKTMNLDKFKDNIIFAKKTGLGKFYFWGTEWWYWLKEKENKPEIWNEAKRLFRN